MKTRLATEKEIKQVVTEIVNNLKLESIDLFDYSDDDMIDDYLEIINNVSVTVIETQYNYNIVNVLMITHMDEENSISNITFITFDNTKLYPYTDDGFISQKITEEEYIEILKIEDELKTLEFDVRRYKALLDDCNNNDENYLQYLKMYNNSIQKLNQFYSKHIITETDK